MKKYVLPLVLTFMLALVLAPLRPAAADPELPFTDVGKNDAIYQAVRWAYGENVTQGTDYDTFSPQQICTRGQVVTFLWRAKGEPEPQTAYNPFQDVVGSYCETAVLWAVENGVTAGTSETTFAPNDTCTWAHILTFLWRANGKPQAQRPGITEGWTQSWYKDAVAWADSMGILDSGDRAAFDPDRPCTRGTTVTWLFRDAVKTVSTVDELASAIAPGRTIYLQAGTYNLTEWMRSAVMGSETGEYVSIQLAWDGYELHVQDVDRLRLCAAPGADGKVQLIVEPRYAQVLTFDHCDIIELSGLTLGHTPEGYCQGGVLALNDCDSVYLAGMDLYGCGTYGIEARDVERLTVKNSVIRDCSYGIMELYRVHYGQFDDCTFRDCREFTMLFIDSSAIFFDNCAFRNNTWGQYSSFLSSTVNDQTVVQFTDCTLDERTLAELKEQAEKGFHVSGNWN